MFQCGCPQAIAKKGNYGAFFMDQDNGVAACNVLRTLRQHLPASIAVSAKIRLPKSDTDLADRIERLVGGAGVDFLTIHGRTVFENKTAVRAVNTNAIRTAVEIAHAVRPDFPVIANGGVEFKSDVAKLLRQTGAAAVMSSEGLLETPNIFAVDSAQLSPAAQLQQQFQMARDYLAWCYYYPPVPGVMGPLGTVSIAKGHLFKMLHRYLQEHVDLRDQLATRDCQTLVQLWRLIEDLYSRYARLSREQLVETGASSKSWYRRHWEAASRLHQRDRQPVSMSTLERKELAKSRILQLRSQKHIMLETVSKELAA
jgi:tRNA-dihydrouridine synthase 1